MSRKPANDQLKAGQGEPASAHQARTKRNTIHSLLFSCLPLTALLLVASCRSPWIQCIIVNRQATPVSLVEVNYPGGSFGVQAIAPGASYHYRFHSLSSKQLSLDFTDAAHHDHSVKGPQLLERQEGTLRIEILPDNQVTWSPSLTVHR